MLINYAILKIISDVISKEMDVIGIMIHVRLILLILAKEKILSIMIIIISINISHQFQHTVYTSARSSQLD